MLTTQQPDYLAVTEIARLYCGSYRLVEHVRDGVRFRSRGALPCGYREVPDAYDGEGLLKPEFWVLPRISYGAKE